MGSASVALVPVDMISEGFLTLSAAVSEERGKEGAHFEVAIEFIPHRYSYSVALFFVIP